MQTNYTGGLLVEDYNADGDVMQSPFSKLVGAKPKSVGEAAVELTCAGIGVVANKPASKQPATKEWQKRGLASMRSHTTSTRARTWEY
jgi:hypothetical protein